MTGFAVIIPTHAPRRPWLIEAVSSALAAPGCCRVIVIDDGSPTPVPGDWFENLGGDSSTNITLARQMNAGPSAARNRGIEIAFEAPDAPPWIVFLDDDDALLPDGPHAMIEQCQRLDAVACVAGRYEVQADGVERQHPPPAAYSGGVIPGPGEVFRPIAIFGGSGMLVRTEMLKQGADTRSGPARDAPRFDESLVIGEDRDMLRRLAAIGPVAVCGVPALRVRIHASAANLTSPARYERRIRDHAQLVARWCDAASEAHFKEATRWLAGAAAKANVSDEAWRTLTSVCESRGWSMPIKARARRAVASLFGARAKGGSLAAVNAEQAGPGFDVR